MDEHRQCDRFQQRAPDDERVGGVDDAGATSQQKLTAGDGYVQFTVGESWAR